MKEFDKNQFDEIFRTGLTSPDLTEVDQDWELMKARLQSKPKRTIAPYYLLFISSVAALLLLVSSLIFNNDEVVKDQLLVKVPKASEAGTPVIVPGIVGEFKSSVPDETVSRETEPTQQAPEMIYYSTVALSKDRQILNTDPSPGELAGSPIPFKADSTFISGQLVQPIFEKTADKESTITASSLINDINLPLSASITESEPTTESEDKKELKEQSKAVDSRLSLAINFAPDMNGVDQFQSNKLSYTIGAGLIYSLSKKFSIEAGASYGRKSYQTGFSSFRPASYNLFPIKPNLVSSGFDVMDIQLNMGYTLMKKGKSTIGLGAGLSSYLMLDEQYSFTYPNINARGLSSFHTGYQNNHFFGIANLNLSYKRHLTNNIQLAFNPYLKLPLTSLGYGNIRLRSAGMSVGVVTKLNKDKR